MLNGALTNRYTQGLYLVADSHGLTDKVDEGLKVVSDTLKAHLDLRSIVEHPMISADQKVQVMEAVLGNQVDPLVLRFLRILFARGRSAYVAAVQERFHTLTEEARGRVTIQVETAMPLKDADLAQIQDKLSAALNKQAQTEVSVNPGLVAGFRMKIGNRVMDASVQGALEQFRNKLLASQASKEGTL